MHLRPFILHWQDGLKALGLATLYALLASVTLRYFSGNGVVSLLWPSSGLALAALLIGGRKLWPGILIGALAGNMAAGSAFGISLLIACGNTLEAITALWLLTAHRKFNVTLIRPLDYLLLAIAASVGASVSALVGTGTLYLNGLLPQSLFMQNLLQWWQGDVLGILLVTPLVLVWRQPLTCLFRCPRFVEGIACFGLALLFGLAIFLEWFHVQIGDISRGYWMFLFVAWAGMRFGRHGALLVISMVAVLAPLSYSMELGYFGTNISQININNMWFYLLILTTVGITLALSIHARNQVERRESLRTQVLELIASNAPLTDILNTIVLGIEKHHPRMFCSILLLDKQGKHLHTGAAPSLPDFYNNIVNGLEIGTGAGSCGTSAYSGKRVIVESIQTHPYWVPYREVAAKAGLAACWSEPIKAASGNVVGTFAIYHRKASTPTADDIQLIEQAAKLTAIALEKQAATDALQTSSEHLRTIIESSPECIKLVNSNEVLLSMNAAGLQMIEADEEASVIGSSVIALINPEYRDAYRQFNANVCRGEKASMEFEITSLKGTRRWVETYAVPFLDKTTNQTVQLGITRDITQRKESQDMIWRQANFDLLTGLPNRHMFHDRLEQAIKKAHRSGLLMALMFIDLDRFKEVNDSLGHGMGDALLQEAAHRLSHCVRETDVVARLGGDEFTVIVGDLNDRRNADHIAQNILNALSKPFEINNEKIYISASIGITLYPEDATSADILIRNADQAMYQAKNTGRDRFCYFTKAMQEAAQNRLQLENELHQALNIGNQFQVHYQPIIQLATGTIHKAEALLRWYHPTMGMISPATFIPVAEDTGMIVEIGNWVFEQAAQQVIRWRTKFAADFQISVNKSPAQIHAAIKMQNNGWCKRLKQMNMPGQSIVVEITEGLLLDGSEDIKQHLLEFRDAGVQVALDDFGTGYSSLAYIKKFDIDYLKIDQSFIRNLKTGSEDFAVCEAIIVMAHKLGMKVIAEGVETAEQRDLLLSIGCDYAQGYLFSKPIPAEELEQLLVESVLVFQENAEQV